MECVGVKERLIEPNGKFRSGRKKEKHRNLNKPAEAFLLTNPMLSEKDHCFPVKEDSTSFWYLRYISGAAESKFLTMFFAAFSAHFLAD